MHFQNMLCAQKGGGERHGAQAPRSMSSECPDERDLPLLASTPEARKVCLSDLGCAAKMPPQLQQGLVREPTCRHRRQEKGHDGDLPQHKSH